MKVPLTFRGNTRSPLGLAAFLILVAVTLSSQATSVLQLDSPTNYVDESATGVAVTVVRIGDPAGNVAVNFTTVDGSAVAGVDYVSTNGTMAFQDGESIAKFEVSILRNPAIGTNATFSIVLTNSSGDCLLGRTTETITIVESDTGLYFAATNYSIVEGNVDASVTVKRCGRLADTTWVTVSTADGSAQAGADYIATNQVLTFLPGQTGATARVQILDNSEDAPEVTVRVEMKSPTGGAILVDPAVTVLTILDNDLHLITTLDPDALRHALEAGGRTIIACDGVVTLNSNIVVSSDASLDASGRNYVISGNNATRLFQVAQGARLAMTNIVMADGYCNTAGGGGAGLYNQGSLLLVNCTLTNNNQAGGYGGAIFLHYTGSLRVLGCSFLNNTADVLGGAIAGYTVYGPVSITNCTFYGNRAELGGALSFMDNSYPSGVHNPITVVNCSFLDNSGGTIYCRGGTMPLNLLNTAVKGASGSNFDAVVTDWGHNVSSDASANFTSPFSLNSIDPRMTPPADNGGPTLTIAPLPGSPLINGGAFAGAPSVDQRGYPRPFGNGYDIGAVEYTPWHPYNTLRVFPSGQGTVVKYLGTPGTTWCLLKSADLHNWEPVATNTVPSGGVLSFTNSADNGTAPISYYWIKQP